jgi:primosomal replication protein PriB
VLNNTGLRRTPAGIATLRFTVTHEGKQTEADRQRQVEMEMELTAFGAVAEAIAKVEQGTTLNLAGFIDRKGGRHLAQGATATAQLELHVTEFARN